MSATNFYPPVSELIQLDKMPEKLGFIKSVVNNILEDLAYKNLLIDIEQDGHKGYIGITIIPYQPLDLGIPGTDMSFILNPSSTGDSSEFQLSIHYDWKILKFVRGFRISNFAGTAKALFDLLLEVFAPTITSLLKGAIQSFIDNTDPIAIFITNFNDTHTPLQLTVPNQGSFDADISDLVSQLEGHNIDIINLIFNDYIEQTYDTFIEGLAAYKQNIENLFNQLISYISLTDFEEILVPQASAFLNNISVGLLFPTKYLRQVDPSTLVPLQDANGKDVPSLLIFNVGSLKFSTEHGFEFENENSFNFPTSEVGKTGLIVEFHNLKVDLSRTKNIPEADADGRPTDFIGAYVTEATITLPKKWFKEQNSTAQIYGRNLLIGTGGISGNLGLEAHPTTPPSAGQAPELSLKLGSNSGFEIALSSFNVAFQQNAILNTDIKGSITIPTLKEIDDNGDAVSGNLKLDIMMHFDPEILRDGDFSITASPIAGRKKIGIKDVFDFEVDTFIPMFRE